MIVDRLGNDIAVGDLVVYALKTRDGDLGFGRVVEIIQSELHPSHRWVGWDKGTRGGYSDEVIRHNQIVKIKVMKETGKTSHYDVCNRWVNDVDKPDGPKDTDPIQTKRVLKVNDRNTLARFQNEMW